MPCAGAEGFLVMSRDRAKWYGLPYAALLSAEEAHNPSSEEDDLFHGGWRMFRQRLFDAADCAPNDIDILQTYDDYPIMVFQQLEDLGFCPRGEAAQFVQSQTLTVDGGGLAHNTSGGQLSAGQAGFAGGFLGVTDAVRHLTGRPLGSRTARARRALVSGIGMLNYDRSLCSAAAVLGQA